MALLQCYTLSINDMISVPYYVLLVICTRKVTNTLLQPWLYQVSQNIHCPLIMQCTCRLSKCLQLKDYLNKK